MADWQVACSEDEVAPGTGRECLVGDRIIALFRQAEAPADSAWHAVDGICAHNGGPLGKGCLTGTTVTCPWHGWQYDVTSGRHLLNVNIRQQRFAVRIADGKVWVNLQAGGGPPTEGQPST